MGIRTRSATPGTILMLGTTVLLAIVSFNTPLLKSLYFLSATYTSGQYGGTITLGTLGYCLAGECVGPTVGYEFNPNTLLGVTVFNIPQTITKYLTYTLILHPIALLFALLSFIFGLLSHISSLSVLCFPTCFASIASSISLLALIFDLIIFYIAKTRIDAVSGASASIGISVWLVLAAWLLAGFGGCAFGVGRCCVGRRANQSGGDDSGRGAYLPSNGRDDLRLQALRDEQLRKKEQGLPSFQELERAPLNGNGNGVGEEDKYLYEDQGMGTMPGGLRRDGSVVQGVGMGYGRRNDRSAGGVGQGYEGGGLAVVPPARRPSAASGVTYAGAAGVGAGGGGVDVNRQQGYDGYYGNDPGQAMPQNYHDGYNDPYAQQAPYDPYSNQSTYIHTLDPYAQQQHQQQHQYPPQPPFQPAPTPHNRSYDNYNPHPQSSDSHYADPGPRVSYSQNDQDAYGGYDDGLGAIGRAATSPQMNQGHERDYTGGTGGTFGYDNVTPYPSADNGTGNGIGGLHVPRPQHLGNHNRTAELLRSQMSPVSEVGSYKPEVVGGRDDYGGSGSGNGGYSGGSEIGGYAGGSGGRGYEDEEEEHAPPPPSYGAVAGNGGYQQTAPREKSSYR